MSCCTGIQKTVYHCQTELNIYFAVADSLQAVWGQLPHLRIAVTVACHQKRASILLNILLQESDFILELI